MKHNRSKSFKLVIRAKCMCILLLIIVFFNSLMVKLSMEYLWNQRIGGTNMSVPALFGLGRLPLPLINHSHPIPMSSLAYLKHNYVPIPIVIPHILSQQRRLFDKEVQTAGVGRFWHEKSRWTGRLKVTKNAEFLGRFDGPGCGHQSSLDDDIKKTVVLDAENSVCPVFVPNGNSFQHFVLDVVPKLVQAYDVLRHGDTQLVLEQPRLQDEHIIVDLLKSLKLDHNVQFHKAGARMDAKYMLNACNAPPFHPSLFMEARRLIGAHRDLQVARQSAHVVFISRRFCDNCGRNIINEAQFLTELKRRYGDGNVIEHNPMKTVEDLLFRFSRAKLIIGVNGGGLLTMFFATAQTKVLEIVPNPFRGRSAKDQVVLWLYSLQFGVDYWKLYERSIDEDNNVQLNLTSLNQILDEIDNS